MTEVKPSPAWLALLMSEKPKRPRSTRPPRPKPPPQEPAMKTTAENPTLVAARLYTTAGMSLIPVARDGSKGPSFADLPVKTTANGEPLLNHEGRPQRGWDVYTTRVPNEQELQRWYARTDPPGIGIIGGAVSGGLECFDFDQNADTIYPQWRELVEAECPGLAARLVVVRTPRQPAGYHVRFRCLETTIPNNTPLAMDPSLPRGEQTLIETRGTAGYAVAPGSPGVCHQTGGNYVHIAVPRLSRILVITAAEREVLLRCAALFDKRPQQPEPEPEPGSGAARGDAGGRPGDDFNRRGPDWSEILTGWAEVGQAGGKRCWKRPDKTSPGISATTGYCSAKDGSDLLAVFSTNAEPFEGPRNGRPCSCYTKFAAYALIHFAGDHTAAARQLAKEGYGARQQKTQTDRNGETPKSAATPKPAPKARPRLRPYRPFPLGAIGEPARSFVAETASALGCDPAFVALPALAAMAACVGNSRVIRLKRGWSEPSVIWTVIVGDSGTLKTPAYVKAVRHLFSIQETLRGEYDVAHRTYAEQLREYRARSRRARGNRGGLGPPPAEPPYRQIVSSDITIEQLAVALEDNPHGILVARDELAGWLGSFRRFKGRDGGSDLPNWLEIFRAGCLNIDRTTSERRHIFVRRAAVSIAGSIQPRILQRAFSDEFLESGGAARILPAMPPKKPKTWSPLEVHPDTEKAYHDLLDKMRSLGYRQVAGRANVPNVLRLNAEAQDVWIGYVNQWGQEQAQFEGEMAAVYSKLEAYAARFAMLYHITADLGAGADDLTPVGVQAVTAGITLSEWFAREAQRIYAVLGESDEQRDARRLVEFIQSRGGRISVRALQRSHSHKYRDRGDAQAALDALVQAGMATWEEVPTAGGGHCASFLKLNPTPDTRSDDDPEEGGETEELPDTR
jgi:hypothetical protein